ncbi:MAG: ABC transporter substrate binding protein [Pseudomonadota bacterium]
MQKLIASLALACGAAALPSQAIEPLAPEALEGTHVFKVEVLQVTDIEPFQEALAGFLDTLRSNDIVDGKNLSVHRVKIDFDIEHGGFWSRMGVLMRIRQEAVRIAAAKPDLVLTIGTPATRYARPILEDARIPVVFTAVANPEDAGCVSLVDAGPGATGSTLYTDMNESMRIVRRIFPHVSRIGMIHTDDENGVSNVAAATASARQLGMAVTARQVAKTDSIVPSLKAMYAQGQGAQMFAVPLDAYYGLRRYEPATDLGDFGAANQVPVVTLAMVQVPGAVLYLGADFAQVGSLAGMQAAKILKYHVKPDVLPILRQQTPNVLVDPARLAELHMTLQPALLANKSNGKNGFWQIAWGQLQQE